MCPEPYFRLLADDSLIMFGREHDLSHHDSEVLDAPRLSLVPFERARGTQALRSLLVLGWTRKVPVVLSELVQSCQSTLEVKVLSTIDLASRQEDVLAAGGGNLTLDHALADYTVPEVLKACSPARFDAVLLVGSDRLESGAESDARSIVGCQVLRSCLAGEPRKPRIVIELMEPDNAALLDHDEVEALVSPQLLGRALAQVALVPDLCAVYDDLFGAGGAELSVHSASEYGIDGAPMTFGALRVAAARMGHVLLGAQAEGERTINMNPPPSTPFDCSRDVRVVVAVRAE